MSASTSVIASTVASEGGSHVQFSDSAIATIFKASGGVPRLINLICDRALQRGFKSRAMLIESSLIHEAVTSLGIEAPVAEADVTRVELPAGGEEAGGGRRSSGHRDHEGLIHAGDNISAGSTQILSEFAAEADLAGPLSGGRSKRVALALIILGLAIAGGIVAGFLYYQAQSVDLDAATLPARPQWTFQPYRRPCRQSPAKSHPQRLRL